MPKTETTQIRKGGSYLVEKDPATGEETVTQVEQTLPAPGPGESAPADAPAAPEGGGE